MDMYMYNMTSWSPSNEGVILQVSLYPACVNKRNIVWGLGALFQLIFFPHDGLLGTEIHWVICCHYGSLEKARLYMYMNSEFGGKVARKLVVKMGMWHPYLYDNFLPLFLFPLKGKASVGPFFLKISVASSYKWNLERHIAELSHNVDCRPAVPLHIEIDILECHQ